jgi:hypothetical protein
MTRLQGQGRHEDEEARVLVTEHPKGSRFPVPPSLSIFRPPWNRS